MPARIKYSKEMLEEAARCSVSVAGVLRHLGVRPCGGFHTYISGRLKHFEIDTSHFTGQGTNRGPNHKGGPRRKTWREILVLRTSGRRQKAHLLRRALIEHGRPYKCVDCGCEGHWQRKPIVLQVDHLNGDFLDDRSENLAFRCPNCHSQTKGWCNSQGLTDITTDARQHQAKRRRNGGKADSPDLGSGAR